MPAARRRDLLQTLVVVCIGLTPAWLLPQPWAGGWLLVGLLVGAPAAWLTWRHAPWVPTPAEEIPRIVRHLALRADQGFCDLGAGDGRLVLGVGAATGARCEGIEASPLLFAVARLRGAAVRFGDLYAADLSAYDAVYVWGTHYSVGTPRFGRRMQAALRPGARLVSYHQPVHGMEPVEVDEGGLRPIYVYVIGSAGYPGSDGRPG